MLQGQLGIESGQTTSIGPDTVVESEAKQFQRSSSMTRKSPRSMAWLFADRQYPILFSLCPPKRQDLATATPDRDSLVLLGLGGRGDGLVLGDGCGSDGSSRLVSSAHLRCGDADRAEDSTECTEGVSPVERGVCISNARSFSVVPIRMDRKSGRGLDFGTAGFSLTDTRST